MAHRARRQREKEGFSDSEVRRHDAEKENHDGQRRVLGVSLVFLLLLLLVDLAIFVLAVHFILQCGRIQGWSVGIKFLLIFSLLTPFSLITLPGIFIYVLAGGCKQEGHKLRLRSRPRSK